MWPPTERAILPLKRRSCLRSRIYDWHSLSIQPTVTRGTSVSEEANKAILLRFIGGAMERTKAERAR